MRVFGDASMPRDMYDQGGRDASSIVLAGSLVNGGMSIGGGAPGLHILLAMAPRSYQEALAISIRERCPWARLSVVHPAELDAALQELHPDLVVTSRVTEFLLEHVPAWVVLYPEGAGLAINAMSGVQATSSDLTMDRLLDLIEEAARLTASFPSEPAAEP